MFAGSYAWHLLLLLVPAGAILILPANLEKTSTSVVEFVLQHDEERNVTKTNLIALKSSEAHAQRDPNQAVQRLSDATSVPGEDAKKTSRRKTQNFHMVRKSVVAEKAQSEAMLSPKLVDSQRAAIRRTTEMHCKLYAVLLHLKLCLAEPSDQLTSNSLLIMALDSGLALCIAAQSSG